jgi:hypothetical protein
MTLYIGKAPSALDIERDDIARSLEVAKDIFDEAEELQDLVAGITDLVQDLNAIKGCLQSTEAWKIEDTGAAIEALKWLIEVEESDYENCLARGDGVEMHPFVLASRALGLDVSTASDGGNADEALD